MGIVVTIEFLIFFSLLFLFVGWTIWKRISNKRALKKYNPENDKARLGEEKRRRDNEFEGRDRKLEDAGVSDAGLAEPPERTDISSADVSADGKTGRGIGKTSHRDGKTRRKFRSPFRRK